MDSLAPLELPDNQASLDLLVQLVGQEVWDREVLQDSPAVQVVPVLLELPATLALEDFQVSLLTL